MRKLTMGMLLSLILGSVACSTDGDESADSVESGGRTGAARRLVEQVPPPVDLKAPPADATKTASGLVYKKLTANAAGEQAKRSDTALVNYTG